MDITIHSKEVFTRIKMNFPSEPEDRGKLFNHISDVYGNSWDIKTSGMGKLTIEVEGDVAAIDLINTPKNIGK